MELILVFAVLFFALFFTYTNGFHDTANAIATVVGTKVLTPRQAILLAAITNLFGAFFGLAVAKTISSGLVDGDYITQSVLVCVLISAIIWNLVTWYYGIPSSSSHALIGSLVGGALGVAVCLGHHPKAPAPNPATAAVSASSATNTVAKPYSAWSAIKWSEVNTNKTKRILVPAPPEVIAALGDGIKTNGTHKIKVGSNTVSVVAFCDRVSLVEEKRGTDKSGLYYKVVLPMVLSPLMGFFGGLVIMGLLYVILRNWRPVTVNRTFGRLQLASSAYMGFSHGMNDATKCMGIITLALVVGTSAGHFHDLPGWLSFLKTKAGSDPFALTLGDHMMSWLPRPLQFGYMPAPADVKSQGVPNWVVVLCALTMAAGTAAGGWKIIKTMGAKLVKLQPVHGFAAETTGATVLAIAGVIGAPVSTTHAITTSIMGVGCAKRFSALKLKVVERIIWAWVLTIPATAGVAFGLVCLGHALGWIHF